jgi:hypothetical protein
MSVGSFGKTVFSVSSKKVYSFSNLKITHSASWKEHGRYGKKPISEFVSPELQSMTLDIHLDFNLGVKPRDEIEKWGKICETGKHDVFVIGNKQIGKYEWKVESVSEAWNTIFNKGQLISADLSITLSEYIDIDKDTTSKNSSNGTKKALSTKTSSKMVSVSSLNIGSTYKIKTLLTGYYTSMEAKNLKAINQTGKVYPGNYYVFNIANGMINVTKVKGSPGSWINPSKNK